jgi:hypothetical protein
MKIKKILAVRHGYIEPHGPFAITTIGMMVDGRSFIFGEFYEGPGTCQADCDELRAIEAIVDELVQKGE